MSRIIAGSRRGHRVTMPPSNRTRPTSDRVREALFSALTAWAGTSGSAPEESLSGCSFCDLYAGSGAVGLEAASRGAAPVLLVEGDSRTAAITARNASSLRLSVQLRTSRVETVAAEVAATGYDIVFADPPYDLPPGKLAGVLAGLVERGWLAPGGLVVVERSRRSDEVDWPAVLTERWSRRYGESVLHFGQGDAAGPEAVEDPPPAGGR